MNLPPDVPGGLQGPGALVRLVPVPLLAGTTGAVVR